MADKNFKVKTGLSLPSPLPVDQGGTGQTSANNTLNALLPLQTDNAGKVLKTDGTDTSWVAQAVAYQRGGTASRPVGPTVGDLYYNTDTNIFEQYTSLGWFTVAAQPQSPSSVIATNQPSSRAYNDGQMSVAFTPSSNGGHPSTFIVTPTPTTSPATFTGSSSPISVTGLASSTQYTYTVSANSAYGTSSASSASTGVTATTVPQAPTTSTPVNVTGRAYGSTTNSVNVPIVPNATGGSSITSYTVTSNPGSLTGTSSSSPVTVSGLTVGTAYTFTSTATNANGTSLSSSASSSITPSTVPQAPTIGTATGGEASATVAYTAGATGGSTVITYTATSNPGGFTGTGASPITVSGLTNGTAYTFTVTATNANGTSAASSASNSVTPAQLTAYDLIGNMYGNAQTMTISNIPQTYKSLILKGQASLPSGYSGRMYLRLNGVSTGTIYWPRWYYVTGTAPGPTVASQTAANELPIGQTQIAGNYTRVFEIEIPYYTQADSKSISIESGLVFSDGSVSDVTFGGGQFASGSPITSVTIYTDNAIGFSSWNQTTVALYGVKG